MIRLLRAFANLTDPELSRLRDQAVHHAWLLNHQRLRLHTLRQRIAQLERRLEAQRRFNTERLAIDAARIRHPSREDDPPC